MFPQQVYEHYSPQYIKTDKMAHIANQLRNGFQDNKGRTTFRNAHHHTISPTFEKPTFINHSILKFK